MNNRTFEHHMSAMKVHFASGSTESFSLPNAVLFSDFQFRSFVGRPTWPGAGGRVARALAANHGLMVADPGLLLDGGMAADPGHSRPSDLEKVATTIKRKMTFFVDDASSSAQVEVDKLKAIQNPTDSDINAFINILKQLKAAAKKESERIIDDAFDKLMNVGKAKKSLQSKVLRIASSLGSFLTVLYGKIATFLKGLFKDIKDFLADAAKWIKDTAENVANFAKDTINSIGGFIDSIF